jgi:uncharacterized protein HemX
MAEERIVETPHSTTTTRTTDAPQTVVVERRGGGGWAIALVLLVAVLVGGYFLMTQTATETRKDAAVEGAAKSVEKTADTIGDAVTGEGK